MLQVCYAFIKILLVQFSLVKKLVLCSGALVLQNLNIQLIYLYLDYIFKENIVPRLFMII